jgi:decaprenylphospho-beta-D-erythro-pentofuranosid-2-ulose 2-reductase
MKKILIIGASSAIASATARLWANEGHALYLLGRNSEKLAATASDLLVRGAKSVQCLTLDLNDLAKHESVIQKVFKELGGVDIILIAHGTLSVQQTCEKDFAQALLELNTNGISVISLLTHLANICEAQGHGSIAVISSVAGDRGRPSNYVYGAAKAAVDAFCSGLRSRLFKRNVHVLVIKPGFVATPMTAHLNLPKLITAKPEYVAQHIHQALLKQKNTLYTPSFWSWIMLAIRLIPTQIFKKLSL